MQRLVGNHQVAADTPTARIDITELQAGTLPQYVKSAVSSGSDVFFERVGGRTFLVTDS
jgi:hypothetical protein